jgi:hypothetical protein
MCAVVDGFIDALSIRIKIENIGVRGAKGDIVDIVGEGI